MIKEIVNLILLIIAASIVYFVAGKDIAVILLLCLISSDITEIKKRGIK